MIEYRTAQRKVLQDFFTSHPHEVFSAREIVSVLGDRAISLSAVYRNLSALEGMNLIRRCAKNGTREAFYQYKNTDECKNHIHMTCTKCGATIHMTRDDTAQIIQNAQKYNGFSLDSSDTVIMGLCGSCGGKRK